MSSASPISPSVRPGKRPVAPRTGTYRDIHKNIACWIKESKGNPFVIEEAPCHCPFGNEILVKNYAIAVNPVDWKIQESGLFVETYPAILGCDVAGEIIECGAEVEGFQPGDRVMGHAVALTSKNNRHGGFQEYTTLRSTMTAHIPPRMSYEQAVVLPLAVDTAAAGLFQKEHLALPLPSLSPSPTGKTLLVWGGSSSVGTAAIQLARAAGLDVVTTASKRNHELCQSLGASHVFDYNDSNIVDHIVKALQGKKLAGAYDAISEESSLKPLIAVLGKLGGSHTIASTLPGTDKYSTGSVTVKPVFALSVEHNEIGPAIWRDFLPAALAQRRFLAKPDPLVVGEGLESLQEACNRSKAGVSGQKVVVVLPEEMHVRYSRWD